MKKSSNTLCTLLVLTVFFAGSFALKNANDFKSGLFKFNSIASGNQILPYIFQQLTHGCWENVSLCQSGLKRSIIQKCKSENSSRFSSKFFYQIGIYEIDIGDQFNNKIVMAYGDYNGDKYTDMITVSAQTTPPTKQTISVNIWSTNQGLFVENPLPFPTCIGTIANIIPGDINYDGQLDMVVVTLKTDNTYCLDFFQQTNCETTGCLFDNINNAAIFNVIPMVTQPMAGDFTGQHFFQLLLFNPTTQAREIYEFQSATTIVKVNFSDLYATDDENCQDYPVQYDFTNVHFSSVVDFNGDCRSDLVIQSTFGIEFWAKADNNKFCFVYKQNLNRQGASLVSFTFSDINYDGSVDIVALIKDNASYRIVIMYNKYRVSSSSLCSKFKQYPYEDISSESPYVQYQNEVIDVYSNAKGYFPLQIRLADIDWDGMPDMIITAKSAVQLANYGAPLILMNSSCDSDSDCSNLQVGTKRQFIASTNSNYSTMYKVETINISFFDINEDGKIDFMINTYSNGKYGVRCFFNYVSTDAFFLKALGLNGQCTTSACQSSIYYGASYQCKVTTLNTDYKTATGVQLPQSAHGALQLPFVILGLARTNNYVENFTIGLPQPDADTSSRYWTPIIPNSQLIVFPYTLDPNKWEISIFVQPNDALIIVILVTVAILVLLGGIIIYYHRKEKQEEIQNQQEFLKMIR